MNVHLPGAIIQNKLSDIFFFEIMKNFVKQPLFHFLLVGLGFFILFKILNPEQENYKTIVVDKQSLLTHLQYRSKAFNNDVFEQRLAELPVEELELIINEFVREEVLYREAMALGLDQEDYIIKRRMIQKVEFMTEGVTDALVELNDQELDQYYQENKDNYYFPPQVTFTHVFFEAEKWGKEKAAQKAEVEIKYLNRHSIPFEAATSRADRFHYHTNYVARDPEYVASHFGKSMSGQIFESTPSDKWVGPFESLYGYHLVLLTSMSPGVYPDLIEIKEKVNEDARYWKKQQHHSKTIQSLVDTYEVKLEYQQDS